MDTPGSLQDAHGRSVRHPGSASPPSSGSLRSQPGNDTISPPSIVLASLHPMTPSRKARFTDCLHLGHWQMWDPRTLHIGGCSLGIFVPHLRHSRRPTERAIHSQVIARGSQNTAFSTCFHRLVTLIKETRAWLACCSLHSSPKPKPPRPVAGVQASSPASLPRIRGGPPCSQRQHLPPLDVQNLCGIWVHIPPLVVSGVHSLWPPLQKSNTPP